MYEVGNLVTLKSTLVYDRKTTISKEEIGEIIEIAESDGTGTRFVVAFQDRVDVEGVTPLVWCHPFAMELHQL